MSSPSERVLRGIEEFRAGRMVILVDDEDRENEGDLCMAASLVTPEAINFMATHGRGLICLAFSQEHANRLRLPMMVQENEASLGTAFTVSIEARHGVSTGISAKDRAVTIKAAISNDAVPADIVSPGHVFPILARPGGVLVRTGQTEGSVDLAKLAGLNPAGVICEIMREDGEMARMPELEKFSAEHDIPILSVADLISYRLLHETVVSSSGVRSMRPAWLGEGEPFQAHLYTTDLADSEYLAFVRGDVRAATKRGESVLVRAQSICPIGDSFGVKPDMQAALRQIDEAGAGVFLYVFNKSRASLTSSFAARLDVDSKPSEPVVENSETLRDFGLGAQVLADLGCEKIRLMTDSSRRLVGLEGFGIEVMERVPLRPEVDLAGNVVPFAQKGGSRE